MAIEMKPTFVGGQSLTGDQARWLNSLVEQMKDFPVEQPKRCLHYWTLTCVKMVDKTGRHDGDHRFDTGEIPARLDARKRNDG